MSIFKGTGILINPYTQAHPGFLPQAFTRTLAAGVNTCVITDELGALAYAMDSVGQSQAATELFGILESSYSLNDHRDDISRILGHANEDSVRSAIQRARRFHLPYKPRSGEKIAAVVVQHDTLTAAAESLCMDQQGVGKRIRNAASGSPLTVFQGTFARTRCKLSDEAIVDVLAQHNTLTAAAKALGVGHDHVSRRVRYAPEGSALAVFKGAFKAVPPQKASDQKIANTLAQSHTITAAALALGMSLSGVSKRIKCADEDSPLAVFKEVFKRAGRRRPQKASDAEIVDALARHRTQSEAAQALGISPGLVCRRIRDAHENSPLTQFKGAFHQGGPRPPRISDEKLADALAQSDTITSAAIALGMSLSGVSRRITRAHKDSPLAVFKGAAKGRPSKISDAEIAEALAKHRTQFEAAQALGVSQTLVCRRIRDAHENSPLAQFKGAFHRGSPQPSRISDENLADALAPAAGAES